MKINRRSLMAGSAAGIASLWLGGCSARGADGSHTFITREGQQLRRGGAPYRVVGANMWYAAWLGADAPFGNRPRLLRELDRLAELGLNNLRIMAAAEEGPLKNAIKPGMTRGDGSTNTALIEGLDFAMAEIGKRGMSAVLVLSNFWEWSGGLQTLLAWVTGSHMDMGDPAHPWPAFADSTARFYAIPQAVERYHAHVAALVSRTNRVTGLPYADDPAILSWQLANEPRPGGSDAAITANREAYLRWIAESAALIRSIDPNHLVSLGQEGTQATNGDAALVAAAHAEVDYLTAHIWPLNWGWVRGDDLAGTWPDGRAKVRDYLATHADIARSLDKPLLIEEFGFPRDGEARDPAAGTQMRQLFYRAIYDAVEESWASGGPIQGSNFWAWNGEARAAHPDYAFRDGDLAYMGDPPHEPQGWYGLFDTDHAMLELVRTHATRARG